MKVSQRIASDTRVQKIADLDGDRILLKLPLSLVEHHPKLQKIRGKSPDIDRLKSSLKDTANGPVYPILVYAELDAKQQVHYFVADGHQRLRAAKESGADSIYGQVITRWKSWEDAFNEAVSVQYARFEMQDIDLFSVMKEGKLTDQELIKMTGKSESTIVRMRKVSDYPLITELIDKQALTTNLAARLIDKANKNPAKINAIMLSLQDKYEEAEKEAKHWQNRFQVEGKPKQRKLADMAKVSYYFKSEKWDRWDEALDSDEPIDAATGRLNFDHKVSTSKAKIMVVDTAKTWEEEIGIYFEGGQKHQDMSLPNLIRFRDSLPMIDEKLNAIIARRAAAEAAQKHPIPPGNPTVTVEAPEAPKSQSASMSVEE